MKRTGYKEILRNDDTGHENDEKREKTFYEEPLAIFKKYPPGSVGPKDKTFDYALVESSDDSESFEDCFRASNKKTYIHGATTTKLQIKKIFNLSEFTTEATNYITQNSQVGPQHTLTEKKTDRKILVYGTDDRLAVKNCGPKAIALSEGDHSASIIELRYNKEPGASFAIANGIMSTAKNEDDESGAINGGLYGIATSRGTGSVAATLRPNSVATSFGYHSISASTGSSAAATISKREDKAMVGWCIAACSEQLGHSILEDHTSFSIAACSCIESISEVKGGFNVALTVDDSSTSKTLGTSKNCVAITTGSNSTASADGENDIAIATGPNSKAKGALGNWIFCVERNPEDYKIIAAKTAQVDGKAIKPNVYYTLKNGEFVEVE
ncbi:hypothetical protein IKE98_00705 [Candidatus Saccharibacteria bacterium]|nr:hypothetical protein [Candidatus Saccharibacteria bacterium]